MPTQRAYPHPLSHPSQSHSFRHVSDCMIGILTCSSSLSSSLGASRMYRRSAACFFSLRMGWLVSIDLHASIASCSRAHA